jgi:lipoprotein-anchoring transpeptidase ErfK/SrfK
MTDLYIRRSDAGDIRRRAALFAALLIVACAAGGYLLVRGCERSPASLEEMAQQVEDDPLIDQLLAEEHPADSPPTTPRGTPPTTAGTPDTAPDTDATDPGARLLARAQQLRTEGDFLAARDAAWDVLARSRNPQAVDRARTLLGEVHIELVTTPRDMPEKVEYVVASGDSLARLAKKFDTTVELLQQSNNVPGSMIKIGDRLRILQGQFRMEIDKSDNLLDLYLNDRFFKRYRVGTGEYNRTPVGEFTITDRIPQPTWWRPDGKAIPYGSEENELGTHWLSLDVRGYGIHGTWKPDTIGRQASAGCIRLSNENIEELYNLIPVGTPVTVTD